MTPTPDHIPGTTEWRHPDTPRLFGMAYDRPRAFHCGACILLTVDERAYQRRVFKIARAWARRAGKDAKTASSRSSAP